MNYYQLCIDGIDKSGKDVLWSQLDNLCNHSLVINVRGLLSNMSYDKIYNRDNIYNFDNYKHVITIYTTVEKEDWLIRCKAAKEKDVSEQDYDAHKIAFELSKAQMIENGLLVLEYNTSSYTPYVIAKTILDQLKKLESIED